MSRVEIKTSDTGLLITGQISFSNVLQLRKQGNCFIKAAASGQEVIINFSGVTSSDVSGLTLMLRWLSYARKCGRKIKYISTPASLLKVADVCGVTEFISE
ncbi:MAG: STAS domain-containing protein [Coxiellaceae bacterium]|nr:STAS domain-containing protein [Coxiellaceae bacterium]